MKNLILAIVCFVSGLVVCFEWMGHDKGKRIYHMLKGPETVEKEVVVKVQTPVVISNDATIQLIQQEYRDALIVISKMGGSYGSSNDMSRDFTRAIDMARDALKKTEVMMSRGGE